MSKVYAIKCENYNEDIVEKSIDKLFEPYNDFKDIIKKGDVVALKVNLVCGATPEKVCTTHPSVVKYVAKKIIGLGAKCIIVDSPGGPYTQGHLRGVYNKTGMTKISEELDGLKLNNDFTHVIVNREENKVNKKFELLSTLDNADYIINLAKFKTHTYMGNSGCVKNMFGAIPGLIKVEMHSKYVDQHTFGDMLIDINQTLKDKVLLNVMDGVIGMEGQGPTGGTPKNVGYLFACENPYDLDLVQCKMIGENVFDFPIIKCAHERNLIDANLEPEICGDLKEIKKLNDFEVPECEVYNALKKAIPPFLQPIFHRLMTRRPSIKKKECRGCKKCFEHCPVHAISMEKKKDNKLYAKIDYQKCIRCFCCQELCPFHVVKIKTGALHKIIRLKDSKNTKEKADKK